MRQPPVPRLTPDPWRERTALRYAALGGRALSRRRRTSISILRPISASQGQLLPSPAFATQSQPVLQQAPSTELVCGQTSCLRRVGPGPVMPDPLGSPPLPAPSALGLAPELTSGTRFVG